MICAKAPYRVSISGGSCDYKSFYEKHGCVITGFALDLYCYVSVKRLPKTSPSHWEIFYSSVEKVEKIEDIKNATIRGTLEFFKRTHPDLDMLSVYVANDASHQSGLATSSALVCALLRALYCFYDEEVTKKQIAEEAVYIERVLLEQAGGIQDSYWSAYAGLRSMDISKKGVVNIKPLPVSENFVDKLCRSSLLFYLNGNRTSYEVAISHNNPDSEASKLRIMELSKLTQAAFVKENIEEIGKLLNESWLNKREISPLVSNPYIDAVYDNIMQAGAYGGKICGSGNGGFFYVIFNEKNRENLIKRVGLPYIDVGVDYTGAKVIFKE
jgi:D-glycero-alpha-D-manno-heptose-7-phosphate kinase